MGSITVVGRRSEGLRCGYCLEQVDEAAPCQGCGVLTHPACRAELGRCPTLGCADERADRDVPQLGAEAVQPLPPAASQGAGRLRRDPPGWWLRLRPYSRLLVRPVVAASVLFLSVGALLLGRVLAPEGFAGDWAMFPWLFALLAGVSLVGQFFELPERWRQLGRLLDDGVVTPMRLRVDDRSAHLEALVGSRRIDVLSDEVDLPGWLQGRGAERVHVHGTDGDGPYVLEFEDGLLVLLEPDEREGGEQGHE